MSGLADFAEAKLALFESEPCPRSISLGSSLTYRSLRAADLARQDSPITTSFNFGLTQPRVLNLHGLWQQIRRHCVPEIVFVEVSPSLVNHRPGGLLDFLPATASIELLSLPLFWQADNLTWRDRAEAFTWDQSFAGRTRRVSQSSWGLTPPTPRVTRDLSSVRHGEIRRPRTTPMVGKRRRAELKRWKRYISEHGSPYRHDSLAFASLIELAREISNDGARVVLHTPPYSRVFYELLGSSDAIDAWCKDFEPAFARGEFEWFAPSTATFDTALFYDWTHFNKKGARTYAKGLLGAMHTGAYPTITDCSRMNALADRGVGPTERVFEASSARP